MRQAGRRQRHQGGVDGWCCGNQHAGGAPHVDILRAHSTKEVAKCMETRDDCKRRRKASLRTPERETSRKDVVLSEQELVTSPSSQISAIVSELGQECNVEVQARK